MSGDFKRVFQDERVKLIVLAAIGGAILTRILSIILPLQIGGIMFHLSLPAMVLLCVLVNEMLCGRSEVKSTKALISLGGAVGVIIDETLWLIVRNPPLLADAPVQVGYWSLQSLISSLLGILLFSVGVITARYYWSEPQDMPKLKRKHWIIAASVLIGGLIFFHVSQAMIRYDVANQDRSLLIMGYEIHHIVEGQILLFISIILILFAGGRLWPSRIAFGLSMVGMLFVADEILYYQFVDVSDAAYFGATTIVSGGLMSLFLLVQLLYRTGALSNIKGDMDV
jgi:hypothetical protein